MVPNGDVDDPAVDVALPRTPAARDDFDSSDGGRIFGDLSYAPSVRGDDGGALDASVDFGSPVGSSTPIGVRRGTKNFLKFQISVCKGLRHDKYR